MNLNRQVPIFCRDHELEKSTPPCTENLKKHAVRLGTSPTLITSVSTLADKFSHSCRLDSTTLLRIERQKWLCICSLFCVLCCLSSPQPESPVFVLRRDTPHRLSQGLNAYPATICSSGLRVAVVPRVIDACLAVLARNAGKAAAENGLDADARHVAGHAAAADVRVVHADLAIGAVDRLDAEAAAGCVGWQGQARGRLGGHQGGLRGHAVSLAVLAAVAARVDFLAGLAGRARGDLETTRPLVNGGQSGGGSQEGEDGEGEITHGEDRVGRVRDDSGEILWAELSKVKILCSRSLLSAVGSAVDLYSHSGPETSHAPFISQVRTNMPTCHMVALSEVSGMAAIRFLVFGSAEKGGEGWFIQGHCSNSSSATILLG